MRTPSGKKKKTMRFQMSEEDYDRAEAWAERVGDLSVQAFAHRALMKEVRRLETAPDPERQAMIDAALRALGGKPGEE